MGRMEPGIMTESSNKRQGGGEDEGMRSNRETEIDRALHEVRLTEQGKEKRERHREGERSEDALRGQIIQLSSYRQTDQSKRRLAASDSQQWYWQR